MGLWGSLVALEVWDLSTPVQIRAAPFGKKNDNKIKKNKISRKVWSKVWEDC